MLIDEFTNKKGHEPEQAVQYLSFILKHSLPNVLLAAKSGGAGAQPGKIFRTVFTGGFG